MQRESRTEAQNSLPRTAAGLELLAGSELRLLVFGRRNIILYRTLAANWRYIPGEH